jgi:hypothetical protein
MTMKMGKEETFENYLAEFHRTVAYLREAGIEPKKAMQAERFLAGLNQDFKVLVDLMKMEAYKGPPDITDAIKRATHVAKLMQTERELQKEQPPTQIHAFQSIAEAKRYKKQVTWEDHQSKDNEMEIKNRLYALYQFRQEAMMAHPILKLPTPQRGGRKPGKLECFNCKGNHREIECPSDTCGYCKRKEGHLRFDCPTRRADKKVRKLKKGGQHAATAATAHAQTGADAVIDWAVICGLGYDKTQCNHETHYAEVKEPKVSHVVEHAAHCAVEVEATSNYSKTKPEAKPERKTGAYPSISFLVMMVLASMCTLDFNGILERIDTCIVPRSMQPNIGNTWPNPSAIPAAAYLAVIEERMPVLVNGRCSRDMAGKVPDSSIETAKHGMPILTASGRIETNNRHILRDGVETKAHCGATVFEVFELIAKTLPSKRNQAIKQKLLTDSSRELQTQEAGKLLAPTGCKTAPTAMKHAKSLASPNEHACMKTIQDMARAMMRNSGTGVGTPSTEHAYAHRYATTYYAKGEEHPAVSALGVVPIESRVTIHDPNSRMNANDLNNLDQDCTNEQVVMGFPRESALGPAGPIVKATVIETAEDTAEASHRSGGHLQTQQLTLFEADMAIQLGKQRSTKMMGKTHRELPMVIKSWLFVEIKSGFTSARQEINSQVILERYSSPLSLLKWSDNLNWDDRELRRTTKKNCTGTEDKYMVIQPAAVRMILARAV